MEIKIIVRALVSIKVITSKWKMKKGRKNITIRTLNCPKVKIIQKLIKILFNSFLNIEFFLIYFSSKVPPSFRNLYPSD